MKAIRPANFSLLFVLVATALVCLPGKVRAEYGSAIHSFSGSIYHKTGSYFQAAYGTANAQGRRTDLAM